MPKQLIITIDGLAGVGKTTISRDLAKLLGYKYISTGWFYRCVATRALKEGVDINNEVKVLQIAKRINITTTSQNGNVYVYADGQDVTNEIFTPLIVAATSTISTYPGVRKILLPLQQKEGKNGGIVVEGRDAGTIVFPNAEWKFYIHASFQIRLKRLFKLLTEDEKKKYPTPESLTEQLKAIDQKDMYRETAPIKIPKGAIIYDNSDSPTSMQDALILQYYITHANEIIDNAIKLKQKK